jgi:hypothetical protein
MFQGILSRGPIEGFQEQSFLIKLIASSLADGINAESWTPSNFGNW